MKFRKLIGYFIILFASIGGTFLYIKDIYSFHRIKSWPSVVGEITSINVKEREYKSKGRLKTAYHPKIKYKYEINGRTFLGSKANCFDNGNGTKVYANEYISQYKDGMVVNVFYNDDQHSESCLDKERNSKTRRMVIFPLTAASLLIIGVAKIKLNKFANTKMKADD